MRVLLVDTNHPFLKEGLEELGYTCEEAYTDSKTSLEGKMAAYEGLVIRSRFRIDRNFLDKASRLQFIARVGAGMENIDVAYAQSKGIELINAPEGNRNAVGEHTLGMLLSLFNKLGKASLEISRGLWLREANRGVELDGKTVGIIGYGNMGKAFAKKLQGFEVEVLCYDLQQGVGDQYSRQVSLSELQQQCDVLSLHTPYNKASYQMVNEAFIRAFTKPFYLINTARGNAVVTDDLVKGLKEKKILGACLDVLEYEKASFETISKDNTPEDFKFLLENDRVLLSPHVAGWTFESHQKLAQTIVDKVQKHFF